MKILTSLRSSMYNTFTDSSGSLLKVLHMELLRPVRTFTDSSGRYPILLKLPLQYSMAVTVIIADMKDCLTAVTVM